MVDYSILSDIKKAEFKAKEIKEKALIDRTELISEAKRTAIQLAGDAEKDAKKKADKIIVSVEKKLESKKEKILAVCRKESDESSKNAQRNIPKAADSVYKIFLKSSTDF